MLYKELDGQVLEIIISFLKILWWFMPDKHLLTPIRHLSLLIDAPKKKELEIEAKGEMNPFLIYSVKIMSLADPTWVSLWSILGMVSPGTVKSTSLQQEKQFCFYLLGPL